MEIHLDVPRANGNVGWQVDQIAEDMPGLGIRVAAHPAGQEPVEATGDDQQRHIKIHFQTNRGGKRIHVEETDRIGKRILDGHARGIPSDQLFGGSPAVCSAVLRHGDFDDDKGVQIGTEAASETAKKTVDMSESEMVISSIFELIGR